MNQFVDNWHQVNSYLYEILPIAIWSQTQHITLIAEIILLGVRTGLPIVEDKHDEGVMYVNSKTGFGSFRIVKGLDHLIYINTEMEEEH